MLSFLRAVEQLQNIPRTGYGNLGVPDPESVSEHCFSVCWYALLLAEAAGADPLRTLRLALLHDLPESKTGDLAAPAVSAYIGAEAKRQIEIAVLTQISAGLSLPQQEAQLTLLAELDAGTTLEARLVHDADKLQMLHRLLIYEKRYRLDSGEFWTDLESREWQPVSRRLYEELLAEHNAL